MFFELEGNTYRIKFYRMGKNTIAELFQVDAQAGEDVPGMTSLGVYGVASVYHTDTFVKKVGRKVALSNLLAGLSDPESPAAPLFLNKEDREMIWAKYFESHKK